MFGMAYSVLCTHSRTRSLTQPTDSPLQHTACDSRTHSAILAYAPIRSLSLSLSADAARAILSSKFECCRSDLATVAQSATPISANVQLVSFSSFPNGVLFVCDQTLPAAAAKFDGRL